MDTLSPEERSDVMRRVRSKNTRPELAVRRLVHSMGYRYRLHGAKIPGHPDIVFRSRRKVIFVHGCWWHRHPECGNGIRMPKSNLEFWTRRLEGNRTRDLANQDLLRQQGWDFLIVWECEIKDTVRLVERLKSFLGRSPRDGALCGSEKRL